MLLALQFMTRLPVTAADVYTEPRFRASVRHYPLIGLLIGLIAATLFGAVDRYFPHVIAVLISTAGILLLTGAFHEDGLADTADGIGGGLTTERSLEIMKDSRIGTYGAVALFVALATKISALNSMSGYAVMAGLIAAHCMSRWSAVVAIASSNYVRDAGTGKPTAAGISLPALGYASVVGLAPVVALYFFWSPVLATGALLGLIAGHILMRWFYQAKIGGYTGDCLGAVQQSSELGVYLGMLACL